MFITEEKATAINNKYDCKKYDNKLYMSVGSDSVFRANSKNATTHYQVCKLEDLSQMISELQAIRHAIEEETGVRF